MDSPMDITIQPTKNEYPAFGQDVTHATDKDAAEDGTGSGSIVYYNADNREDGSDGTTPIKNSDGTVGAPAFVFLGHELVHARQNMKGKRDTNPSPKTDADTDKKGVLDNSEISAREEENKIRGENHVVARKPPYD